MAGGVIADLALELLFSQTTADADLDNLPPGASLETFQPQEPADPYTVEGDPPFEGRQGQGPYRIDYKYTECRRDRPDACGTYTDNDGRNHNGPIVGIKIGSHLDPNDSIILISDGGEYESPLRRVSASYFVAFVEIVNIRRSDGQPDTDGDPPGELESVTPPAPERSPAPESFAPAPPETGPSAPPNPKPLTPQKPPQPKEPKKAPSLPAIPALRHQSSQNHNQIHILHRNPHQSSPASRS